MQEYIKKILVTYFIGCEVIRNILACKEINKAEEGAIAKSISKETKSKRQGRGIVTAGYGNKKGKKATTKRQGHENKMDF